MITTLASGPQRCEKARDNFHVHRKALWMTSKNEQSHYSLNYSLMDLLSTELLDILRSSSGECYEFLRNI